MALFGGARAIWIEPAGDEIAEGVEALLEAPASESPVVAIAGALRKTSALLKLAEAHPAALAHCSYVPEGRDMERMVVDLARDVGPAHRRPTSPQRIAAACEQQPGDRRAGTGQVRALPRRRPEQPARARP